VHPSLQSFLRALRQRLPENSASAGHAVG